EHCPDPRTAASATVASRRAGTAVDRRAARSVARRVGEAMELREFVELAVRLRGEPFSLRDRPYLHAVYASQARNLVIRASRQVEKSTFLANLMVYNAYQTPGLQILFVCPRMDQSLLFSHARLQPVILESPAIRRRLWPSHGRMPIRDIQFANGATIY